jgi:hypothetical protein
MYRYNTKKWKQSTISPILKVDRPTKPHEARPINMLPPYEKLLELVIHQQLSTYLEDNNLLYSQQFGFRKNKSTEQALQVLLSNWRQALNEGKFIIAVSIDLKRAFETISREILLTNKIIVVWNTRNSIEMDRELSHT